MDHTLSSGTYPYSQYMGVPPFPPRACTTLPQKLSVGLLTSNFILLVKGFISLVGLTGNGLVVVISRRLRSHRKHASVLAFIFHLALSDLLVCGVCIPLTISANFIYIDSSSSSSQMACKVLRFLQVNNEEMFS